MRLYLVPLMVGTRDIAFPRLNAFSYWVFLSAACSSTRFVLNIGPDTGWFSLRAAVRARVFAGQAHRLLGADRSRFTEIAGARRRGRAHRHDLQAARARHVARTACRSSSGRCSSPSFMIVFAMPAVMLASTCLIMDRLIGTHFFNPAEGGDALLWQHLFWFFGHPEVYIIFLPATGHRVDDRRDLRRRPIFGYTGAWCCRSFATGFLELRPVGPPHVRDRAAAAGQSFFTAASLMIAIPSGVQIFCWIATLWGGRPRFDDAAAVRARLHLHLRLGGLTGRDARVGAARPAGARHLLRRRALPLRADRRRGLPALRRLLLLVPEDHRPDAERAARASGTSGCCSSASTSTFFPMHILGLAGMPRRVYTYLPEMGWERSTCWPRVGARLIARERRCSSS